MTQRSIWHRAIGSIFLFAPASALLIVAGATSAPGAIYGRQAGAMGRGHRARRHLSTRKKKHRRLKKSARQVLPEGTVLRASAGTLVFKHGKPTAKFLFSDSRPGRPRSMRLLPCLMLQGLERIARRGRLYSLSGEVTQYRGRNYLLLSPAVGMPASAKPVQHGKRNRDRRGAAGPGPTKARVRVYGPSHTEAKLATKSGDAKHTSASSIMHGLLRHQLNSPVLPAKLFRPPTAGPEAAAPDGGGAEPLVEGDFICNRIARLRRLGAGRYELIFSADGRALFSPPMRVLPSMLLQTMRTATDRGRKPLKFKVSGLVMQFRGADYLLLTFARQPMQLHQF